MWRVRQILKAFCCHFFVAFLESVGTFCSTVKRQDCVHQDVYTQSIGFKLLALGLRVRTPTLTLMDRIVFTECVWVLAVECDGHLMGWRWRSLGNSVHLQPRGSPCLCMVRGRQKPELCVPQCGKAARCSHRWLQGHWSMFHK